MERKEEVATAFDEERRGNSTSLRWRGEKKQHQSSMEMGEEVAAVAFSDGDDEWRRKG